MSGVPCISPSFVFHTKTESKPSKEDAFSKYKIYEFVSIIFGCMHLHLEWVLIALVYLEKLMTQAAVEIRVSNWRPLLLTCIILSSKYWEEWGYWNSDFAEITEFDVKDINRMESQAISLLEYKLFVSAHLYSQYYFEVRALYRKVRKEEERHKKKKEYLKYGVVQKKSAQGLV